MSIAVAFKDGNAIIPLKEIESLADHYHRLSNRQHTPINREYFAGKQEVFEDILISYQQDCAQRVGH